MTTANYDRKIVCLCGSTKFKKEFEAINKRETLKGNVVLTVGFFMHADSDRHTISDKDKEMLDVLHKYKISMADEVIVIAPNNYIGNSTASEIDYAGKLGKHITLLNTPLADYPFVS